MNTLKYLLPFFALISTCTAATCKKVCILSNVTCVTQGGFNVYKKVVNGVTGVNKPLDPLHIEKIHGVLKSVKYKLTNITMTGLKNCTVVKLDVNPTDNIYKQYLHCPKLVSHIHFNATDSSDSPVISGKGVAVVSAYDYDILNYGEYAVFVNEDHRPHFFIKTQKSKTHLKGKLEFSITKAHIIDYSRVNATEKYMNKHQRETEDFLHKPIVKKAMEILINAINRFIKIFQMGEVLPENN